MELEILKEQQNPLFNRKEVYAKVKADSVPSKEEVAKALAEKYKVEPNALRVLDVQGKFGVKEFTITANVYSSNEERDKLEQLSKKEREREKSKEEPAPTEAAPAPAETEKVPSEEEAGINAVEEAKEIEEKKAEEDKKEKEKTEEEKALER